VDNSIAAALFTLMAALLILLADDTPLRGE
jgi:hypothetical protein